MNERRQADPPNTFPAWAVEQESVPSDSGDCRQRLAGELAALAQRLADEVCEPIVSADETGLAVYARRLWICTEYHWKRLLESGPVRFAEVVRRLESGELLHGTARRNVLFEVVLAEALEKRERQAAMMFDTDYMPTVRAVARRVAGQRGCDAVENFAAELILPRGQRPPRIAQFQGKTTFSGWLRAVVTNHCTSQFRRREAVPLAVLPESSLAEDSPLAADRRHCESLLRPLFVAAVAGLAAEDRLLVKMLLLDQVPQQALARSLGINSGNVTRRRQRITSDLWERIGAASRCAACRGEVADCLQLVLAGDDRELQRQLADALGEAFRRTAGPGREADDP